MYLETEHALNSDMPRSLVQINFEFGNLKKMEQGGQARHEPLPCLLEPGYAAYLPGAATCATGTKQNSHGYKRRCF